MTPSVKIGVLSSDIDYELHTLQVTSISLNIFENFANVCCVIFALQLFLWPQA